MNNFYSILPIVLNIVVLILIVRIGAVTLMLTGMGNEQAHFQALSAFTGTGFTTYESERVVKNKTRRRIIATLIIFGNGGLVTLFITATTTFTISNLNTILPQVLYLFISITLLYILLKYSPFKKYLDKIIAKIITTFDMSEDDETVDEMLHIDRGYVIKKINISDKPKYLNKKVCHINQDLDNKTIIAIKKGKELLYKNLDNITLNNNHTIILYGKADD